MRITIFGASGKVGRRVVELALQRGHTVTAIVHTHDPFTGTPGLIVKKVDIYNSEDVAQALQGSDVVISTLGSWGRPKRDVLTTAMRYIIPAMEQEGIKRIITLTGHGADAPDHTSTFGHKLLFKLLAPFPMGQVFADGEEHMKLLAKSSLDWTTIRSSVMTGGKNSTYHLKAKAGFPLALIPRQAVAQAIVDQLDSDSYLRQAPALTK